MFRRVQLLHLVRGWEAPCYDNHSTFKYHNTVNRYYVGLIHIRLIYFVLWFAVCLSAVQQRASSVLSSRTTSISA